MSHVASNYVKKLKKAPNGESIPATERALMGYIADGHNEEMGNFQFASVKALAAYCDIGERQLRRVIKSVERKGIIARVSAKRPNGSFTLNRYVFPALGFTCPACAKPVEPSEDHGCIELGKEERGKKAKSMAGTNTRANSEKDASRASGKRTKNGAKDVEKPVNEAAPMTSPSCLAVQGADVADDSTHMSSTTALIPDSLPGLLPDSSPKGDCDDSYIQEQNSLKSKDRARENSSPAVEKPAVQNHSVAAAEMIAKPQTLGPWDEFKAEMLRQLDKLPEKLRAGALEVYDERIATTELIDASCEGDTMTPTWTIRAVDKERTEAGLDMLKANVKSALWKAARGQVNLRVTGGYL